MRPLEKPAAADADCAAAGAASVHNASAVAMAARIFFIGSPLPSVRCGARGRTRTGTALRPGDFKSPVSTSFTTQADGRDSATGGEIGGGSRTRTGIDGFAGRCITL